MSGPDTCTCCGHERAEDDTVTVSLHWLDAHKVAFAAWKDPLMALVSAAFRKEIER